MILSFFIHDMRQFDWKLIRDVFTPSKISISDLEIVPFLKEDETLTSGKDMEFHANELGANFGQHHAEYILINKDKMPKEWWEYTLVFPGTKWDDQSQNLHIACLNRYNQEWSLEFCFFNGLWFPNCRLVRLRKSC